MFENHYGPIIKKISNSTKNIMDKKLAEFGITLVQGQVIAYLWENREKDAINQRDLEAHLSLRCSTIANLLRRMQERGLIIRNQSQSDARNNCISLTDKGTAVHKILKENVEALEACLVKDMSEQERIQFMALLCRAMNNLESR